MSSVSAECGCRPTTLAARLFLVPRTWACMCKLTCMMATGRTLEQLKPSTRPTLPSLRTPSPTTGQQLSNAFVDTHAIPSAQTGMIPAMTKVQSAPARVSVAAVRCEANGLDRAHASRLNCMDALGMSHTCSANCLSGTSRMKPPEHVGLSCLWLPRMTKYSVVER